MSEPVESVSIEVNLRKIEHWSDLSITRALDAHATIGLVTPFEPEREEFRTTFKPFSFIPFNVDIQRPGRSAGFAAAERLFTGTLIDVVPRAAADVTLCDVTAYSRPAKLAYGDMPWDAVPFEVSGLSLRDIAAKLCEPLGIEVVVLGDDGAPFQRVRPTKRSKKTNKVFGGAGQESLTLEGNVQEFLADLARQRGLVMSSSATGQLVFQRSVEPGRPVVSLVEGQQPLLSVEPSFNPMDYYSEITGVVPARKGRRGFRHTEKNPFPMSERQCMSFNLDDTEAADAPFAVKAKMGRMFANMVSYVVTLPTWRTPKGALWAPNQTVTLKAPSAMVYREIELLIRDVTLYQNATESQAQLTLVLPGAFSGGVPARLPWGE